MKPKPYIICPMCEVHGAGPCEECDRLNRPTRKPKNAAAQALRSLAKPENMKRGGADHYSKLGAMPCAPGKKRGRPKKS